MFCAAIVRQLCTILPRRPRFRSGVKREGLVSADRFGGDSQNNAVDQDNSCKYTDGFFREDITEESYDKEYQGDYRHSDSIGSEEFFSVVFFSFLFCCHVISGDEPARS